MQPCKANIKKIVKCINLKEQNRMISSEIGDGLLWGKENFTLFWELEEGGEKRQI